MEPDPENPSRLSVVKYEGSREQVSLLRFPDFKSAKEKNAELYLVLNS